MCFIRQRSINFYLYKRKRECEILSQASLDAHLFPHISKFCTYPPLSSFTHLFNKMDLLFLMTWFIQVVRRRIKHERTAQVIFTFLFAFLVSLPSNPGSHSIFLILEIDDSHFDVFSATPDVTFHLIYEGVYFCKFILPMIVSHTSVQVHLIYIINLSKSLAEPWF